MPYEPYDLTCLRVKLAKPPYNFSQNDITELFDGARSASELRSFQKIAKKCEELVLLPKYKKYLGLIDEICKLLAANEHREIVQITATKQNGKWWFTVG